MSFTWSDRVWHVGRGLRPRFRLRTGRKRRGRLAALLAAGASLSLSATPAPAADQAVLGTRFWVTNPDFSDPARRKVVFAAREHGSAHVVSGDPTQPAASGGAVLQVLLLGAVPSAQTFVLPQGTRADGAPFWRRVRPEGFRYSDPDGERGPVRSLLLRRTPNGTIGLRGRIDGRGGPLDLVPPDAGSGAFVALTLGGGDRYCVRFGDGVLRNRGPRAFRVRRPVGEGCPPLVAGEVLALSYNVAGLPQGISGSDPEINMPLIAPLLNGYELVLVQESWKTPEPNPLAPLRVYHEILEAGSLHPFRSVSAPLPLGSDPRRPSALVSDGLNRFSDFPFEAVRRIAWADCHESAADCLALKGFSMARTTFAPGASVDVYNLHMEAGGAPEDDLLRDQGITQLSTFIQTVSAGRPVIVGGDFNLHTESEPDASQFQRLLAETGLVDVCAALACPQPGRIDKFAFRSAGAVTLAPLSWGFETDVFVRGDGAPLSDHDALAVRFAWELTGD